MKGEHFWLKERKKKWYAEVAKIFIKTEDSVCKVVKKEKNICASFAVTLQTETVTFIVCGKCLVKTDKELSVCVEDRTSRLHSPVVSSEFNISLTLSHNYVIHLTVSRHVDIVSPHIITRRVSAVQ